MSKRALKEIDSAIAELRRHITVLFAVIEKKTAYVRALHAEDKTPLVASDYPAREWAALAERQQAIDALLNVRRAITTKAP